MDILVGIIVAVVLLACLTLAMVLIVMTIMEKD